MEVHFVIFLFVSMSSDFSCKWFLEIKYTMLYIPFALALDFESRLVFLFVLATKAPVHGLERPALFSVSVRACAELRNPESE